MILYRAMSNDEAEATLRAKQPVFIRRYKWFSPQREFCVERVMDGWFGGSRYHPDRYTRLLTFETDCVEAFSKRGADEWMLDRHRAQHVIWKAVSEA